MLSRRVMRMTSLCLMASFVSWACAAERVMNAERQVSGVGPSVEEVEIFSNSGASLGKFDRSGMKAARQEMEARTAAAVADTGALHEVQARLEHATAGTMKFKLTKQVLRALTAPSRVERHILLAALPVSKSVRSARAAADGSPRAVTTYAVNGVTKVAITHGADQAPTVQGASLALRPLFDEVPCSGDCTSDSTSGGGGGDEWATQTDRDDAATAVAAMEYEVEQAYASYQADSVAFVAWWASPAAVTAGGGPDQGVPSNTPCTGKDALAGGSAGGFTAYNILFAVALFSPDPISKVALLAWIAGDVIVGAVAAVAVGNAVDCHTENMFR